MVKKFFETGFYNFNELREKMIDVPDDHKHLWGPYGCWCGETEVSLFLKKKKIEQVIAKLDGEEADYYNDDPLWYL